MSRLVTRARITLRALTRRLGHRREKPAVVRRILMAHQLLLGDALMTTPLVAKLREQHPSAEIVLAIPPVYVPLYATRPYGVTAKPFSMRDAKSVDALLQEPAFDLAVIPGDNRFTWLAQAMNARWIVGWEGDVPGWKNWLLDEAIALPADGGALGDLWASMLPGAPAQPFTTSAWPPPPCVDFERPASPYCVLHVGASNMRKLWPAEAWHELAAHLSENGLTVVWSAGKGEELLVSACDPGENFRSYAGRLDLPQMFSLVANARLLVAPDTGIAHLGKVTGTPTVALFGPGPTFLYDRGRFWAGSPFFPVVLPVLPPRHQPTLFRRRLDWLTPPPNVASAAAEPAKSSLQQVQKAIAQALQ